MPVTTISAETHAKSSFAHKPNPHHTNLSSQHDTEQTNTSTPHERNPDHIPHTNQTEDSYVLTLHTSQKHHSTMTSLRKTYFPPRINKLGAHIALFRAIPGSHLPTIKSDIRSLTAHTSSFPIRADAPFRLSHGIAIGVSDGGPESKRIHAELRDRWYDVLSNQDRGGFRAHYTIMNKVDDEQAVRQAWDELSGAFKGSDGVVEGLALWRYEKGWWKDREVFRFAH
ncbi:hypothetical protein EJ05DRAFT_474242 [Pseudovirgaria hyperparasitica]|uniref:2, 3 cyclic phosphodiesterase n=1 Tax=Pseudovirgaria hyperparasitica TaxID=470096 RepID=A0A6A6WE96_9PEZI|nr:uncharacterized protein EJ05DRAFT_474242 [Pseudovirgaria hyperparasitica]KAF2760354.1 hypothetical protein EJ05DRAFT_474242 [Pseudovirgaria hyperparasitica]